MRNRLIALYFLCDSMLLCGCIGLKDDYLSADVSEVSLACITTKNSYYLINDAGFASLRVSRIPSGNVVGRINSDDVLRTSVAKVIANSLVDICIDLDAVVLSGSSSGMLVAIPYCRSEVDNSWMLMVNAGEGRKKVIFDEDDVKRVAC